MPRAEPNATVGNIASASERRRNTSFFPSISVSLPILPLAPLSLSLSRLLSGREENFSKEIPAPFRSSWPTIGAGRRLDQTDRPSSAIVHYFYLRSSPSTFVSRAKWVIITAPGRDGQKRFRPTERAPVYKITDFPQSLLNSTVLPLSSFSSYLSFSSFFYRDTFLPFASSSFV